MKLDEEFRDGAGSIHIVVIHFGVTDEIGDLANSMGSGGSVFTADVDIAELFEEHFEEAVVHVSIPFVIDFGGGDDGMGVVRGDLKQFRFSTEHLEEDGLVVQKSQGPGVRAVTELSG